MAVNLLNRDFWINKKYVLYIFPLPEKKKMAWSKQLPKHAKQQAFNYETVNIGAKWNERSPKQKEKVIVT